MPGIKDVRHSFPTQLILYKDGSSHIEKEFFVVEKTLSQQSCTGPPFGCPVTLMLHRECVTAGTAEAPDHGVQT